MENIKISVIVPVYNRMEHLRALLICLLNQTQIPNELIITDDGSKEKVLDYIGDLIDEAKFKIKHVFQEDKGFRKTRALNNAVRESSGEILIFCDQDLIFPDDYIEKMLKESKKGIYLMGRAHNTTEEEKDKIILDLNNSRNYNDLLKNIPELYLENMEKQYYSDKKRRIFQKFLLNRRGIRLAGMTYGIYKTDYEKVNGYDEKYQGWGYEDDDFGNRLCVAGIKGKEIKTEKIQLHLYHYNDPSKKQSLNEEYYYKQKKKIFKEKKYYCEFGLENSYHNDFIKILNLK